MQISIIAAVSKNRTIGFRGGLPWKDVPQIRRPDMNHFRSITIGHPVIMGRKTYYSIPKKFRPLEERENIILSKNEFFRPEQGVIVARSIDEALRFAGVTGSEEAFIAGGQSVYEQAMKKYASKMYLTEIKKEFLGDAYFSEFNKEEWKEISRICHDLFDFVEYKRDYRSANPGCKINQD